jgi:hypothetical protein
MGVGDDVDDEFSHGERGRGFLTTDFTDDTDQAEAALKDGHKRHKKHIRNRAIYRS